MSGGSIGLCDRNPRRSGSIACKVQEYTTELLGAFGQKLKHGRSASFTARVASCLGFGSLWALMFKLAGCYGHMPYVMYT